MFIKNQDEYVWPGLIKPLEDELLSSFLIRIAHLNSTKAHTFCKLIWPKNQIWNRDIDLYYKEQIITTLATRTATSVEKIYNTTLASYEGNLFFKRNKKMNSKWILPCGIYHRFKERYCNQFCPRCLLLDKDSPYFRRKWRLSLFVCCPTCKIKLYDSCPNCGNPVNYTRQDLGDKKAIPKRKFSLCTFCDFDLSYSKQIPVSGSLIKNQNYAQNLLDNGFNEQFQYGPLYFDVLYQLVKILNSPKFPSLQKLLHQKSGIPVFERQGGFENHFNFLRIEKRTTLLRLAYILLEDWPDNFTKLCSAAKISSHTLFYEMKYIPYWYWEVVKSKFYKRIY